MNATNTRTEVAVDTDVRGVNVVVFIVREATGDVGAPLSKAILQTVYAYSTIANHRDNILFSLIKSVSSGQRR